ncbi:MAG: proton-conducting membrane transporter [Lachnospiraceae bacterium]|jgi:formate hydrogenlyase subunit 3/multisubunit Na+/H+ antiporter MnhD subunit|nr:proton-conducting membrane transporter [Lachnospiraceae bacterium]
MLLLIAIFLPLMAGALLPVLRFKNRTLKLSLIFFTLAATAGLVLAAALQASAPAVTLLSFSDTLSVRFHLDEAGRIFALFSAFLWLCIGLYAFRYMQHEEREDRFFCFYLLALAFTLALDFAENVLTLYLSFELITLSTFPLVLHNQKPEAVRASLKYLFYSIAGAFLALFGIFLLAHYADTLSFTLGGVLDASAIEQHRALLLTAAFCMLLGFGAKCGLYPLHGWLPSAHPVAPAPASALLSALIVKAGVLCCIRTSYFLFSPDFLRGSWVQTAWMVLALLTIFLGSMMAYREKRLKKRLAYSTVSQVSYILLGLSCFTEGGATGALLHSIFHALIKSGLFMTAGAIIFQTGAVTVDELPGIGKKMPWTMLCFTILSLALVGIPPTGGFVSKWFLCIGALNADLGALSYIAPVILLISALLTAGYLLPISLRGFLPGPGYARSERCEASWQMLLPLFVVTVLSLLLGIFTEPLVSYLASVLM